MRLKALITTGIACTAALGIAAPAQAKSDSGNGKTQRCAAAQNGQHRGFSCETVADDSAGSCARSYTLTYASLDESSRDVNENGWVCRAS